MDYLILFLMIGAFITFVFMTDSLLLRFLFSEGGGCLSGLPPVERSVVRDMLCHGVIVFGVAFLFLLSEIFLYCIYQSIT